MNPTYKIIKLEIWRKVGIKVELIWESALNQEFTVFPAKIWIFEFRFCLKETIKMITYEFKEFQ